MKATIVTDTIKFIVSDFTWAFSYKNVAIKCLYTAILWVNIFKMSQLALKNVAINDKI